MTGVSPSEDWRCLSLGVILAAAIAAAAYSPEATEAALAIRGCLPAVVDEPAGVGNFLCRDEDD